LTPSPSEVPSTSASAPPSMSSDVPSENPTYSPTPSPTPSPSEVPFSSPIPPPTSHPSPHSTNKPSNCVETSPHIIVNSICKFDDQVIETEPFPIDAITIISENGEEVDFIVGQQWFDEGLISVNYQNLDFHSKCDMNTDVHFGDTFYYHSKCIHGLTRVTISVYTGADFDFEECDACDVDDTSYMNGSFCAYTVEIPCEPIHVDC